MKEFQNRALRQAVSRPLLRVNLGAIVAIAGLLAEVPLLCAQNTVPPNSAPLNSATPVSIVVKPAAGVTPLPANAAIESLRIVQEKDGPAVEILSSKPLVPTIQALTAPPRLVIDLPNARLDSQKHISVQADQINALRASQFQDNPPVARVVIDLQAPRPFTWDAAGNRLVVHLGKNPSQENNSPFQTPTVATFTRSPQPVIASVRAAGPLAIAGTTGGVGSAITAGADTTVLNLSSGGEVRVCPGTTVGMTPTQNRHNLMLSMNTGSLEAHFALDASADSVMTPDFRIDLSGPGEFDYAISADNQGNTCVRALAGNTSSAMVTELIDNRTYAVKATDQLMFHSGQLDHVDMDVPLECGCPPPRDAPMRAMNNLPTQTPTSSPHNSLALANDTSEPRSEIVGPANGLKPSPSKSGTQAQLQVEVTAPFVFRATGPPPAPVFAIAALPFDSRLKPAPTLIALPPTANLKPVSLDDAIEIENPPHGFFHKISAFFSRLFH